MPAFFKDAILHSYETVGWDLGSSSFEGDRVEFPDFEILAEQLDTLISESDYASDIKSNYRGALITRVKSLTPQVLQKIITGLDELYAHDMISIEYNAKMSLSHESQRGFSDSLNHPFNRWF